MDSFIFKHMNISTITINVESNIFFNLSNLVEIINNLDSITDESILRTKDLLSKQIELSQKDYKKQIHPVGTISYICYKNTWKGLRRKKKRPVSKKRNDFVNQVTLDIFVEIHRRINVMIFRNGKIKLAGCKNSNDALSAVLKIWELLQNTPAVVIDSENILFVFINVMINISFSLPFIVNKIRINKLFNEAEECIAFYEQTGQQYVNIKMTTDKLNKKGIKLQLSSNSLPQVSLVDIHSIKKPMKTCFMLFDKRVIMSGVDYTVMENHFYKFKRVLDENVNSIKIC